LRNAKRELENKLEYKPDIHAVNLRSCFTLARGNIENSQSKALHNAVHKFLQEGYKTKLRRYLFELESLMKSKEEKICRILRGYNMPEKERDYFLRKAQEGLRDYKEKKRQHLHEIILKHGKEMQTTLDGLVTGELVSAGNRFFDHLSSTSFFTSFIEGTPSKVVNTYLANAILNCNTTYQAKCAEKLFMTNSSKDIMKIMEDLKTLEDEFSDTESSVTLPKTMLDWTNFKEAQYLSTTLLTLSTAALWAGLFMTFPALTATGYLIASALPISSLMHAGEYLSSTRTLIADCIEENRIKYLKDLDNKIAGFFSYVDRFIISHYKDIITTLELNTERSQSFASLFRTNKSNHVNEKLRDEIRIWFEETNKFYVQNLMVFDTTSRDLEIGNRIGAGRFVLHLLIQ
jgi:hypothetical protein